MDRSHPGVIFVSQRTISPATDYHGSTTILQPQRSSSLSRNRSTDSNRIQRNSQYERSETLDSDRHESLQGENYPSYIDRAEMPRQSHRRYPCTCTREGRAEDCQRHNPQLIRRKSHKSRSSRANESQARRPRSVSSKSSKHRRSAKCDGRHGSNCRVCTLINEERQSKPKHLPRSPSQAEFRDNEQPARSRSTRRRDSIRSRDSTRSAHRRSRSDHRRSRSGRSLERRKSHRYADKPNGCVDCEEEARTGKIIGPPPLSSKSLSVEEQKVRESPSAARRRLLKEKTLREGYDDYEDEIPADMGPNLETPPNNREEEKFAEVEQKRNTFQSIGTAFGTVDNVNYQWRINEYIGHVFTLYILIFGPAAVVTGFSYFRQLSDSIKSHVYISSAVVVQMYLVSFPVIFALYTYPKFRKLFMSNYIVFIFFVLPQAFGAAILTQLLDTEFFLLFNASATLASVLVLILTKIPVKLTLKTATLIAIMAIVVHLASAALVLVFTAGFKEIEIQVLIATTGSLLGHLFMIGAFFEVVFIANNHLSEYDADELYPISLYYYHLLVLPVLTVVNICSFLLCRKQNIKPSEPPQRSSLSRASFAPSAPSHV